MLIVVVLSLPFLALLLFKPVLRRLAVRNAIRRPREALLVLIGAMLGTAIITSSYVVGDTLRSSIRNNAYTQYGPIDELVSTTNAKAGDQIAQQFQSNPPAGTDGVLPLLSVTAAASSAGANPKAEPHAQLLELDF